MATGSIKAWRLERADDDSPRAPGRYHVKHLVEGLRIEAIAA